MAANMASAVRVFGLDVIDTTLNEAIETLGDELHSAQRGTTVYFVNANTLNLALDDPDYLATLQRADYVYGDGTGVRWAARTLAATELSDNVNGTDLTPLLFDRLAHQGLTYYLLGGTEEMISEAAKHAKETFDGWDLLGAHHGYLDDVTSREVVDEINACRPNLLLVGMGNPLQEQWLDRWAPHLDVSVAMGIGGLFAYWSGDIDRAPEWMRRLGHEWLHLLVAQPRKASRYLVGNPRFVARIARERLRSPSACR